MFHSRYRRTGLLAVSFLTLAFAANSAKNAWAQETPKTDPPPATGAPAAKPLPPATPEQLAEGKVRLAAAIKAHGGDAFLKLKTVTANGTGTLTPPGGAIPPVPIDTAKIYSGENSQSRIEMETGFGQVILGSAGPNKGWASFGGTVQDQPAGGDISNPTSILRDAAELKTAVVRSLPEADDTKTTADGKKLKGFVVSNDKGRTVTLYLDAETNLLRRVEARQGASSTSVTLDNYKTADGVMLPGKVVTSLNGVEVLSLTVSDFALNKPLDTKLFEKPKE